MSSHKNAPTLPEHPQHSTLTFASRQSFTRRRNSILYLLENIHLKIIYRRQITLAFKFYKSTDLFQGERVAN
ncbi:hypothetical protein ACQP3J_31590, partial [Escherichia coli]